MILVCITCELCIGPPQWQGTESYECPECSWEEIVAIPQEDWEDCGGNLSTFCLKCGQHLEDDCHYELLTDPTDKEKAEAVRWEDFDAALNKKREEGSCEDTSGKVLRPWLW